MLCFEIVLKHLVSKHANPGFNVYEKFCCKIDSVIQTHIVCAGLCANSAPSVNKNLFRKLASCRLQGTCRFARKLRPWNKVLFMLNCDRACQATSAKPLYFRRFHPYLTSSTLSDEAFFRFDTFLDPRVHHSAHKCTWLVFASKTKVASWSFWRSYIYDWDSTGGHPLVCFLANLLLFWLILHKKFSYFSLMHSSRVQLPWIPIDENRFSMDPHRWESISQNPIDENWFSIDGESILVAF